MVSARFMNRRRFTADYKTAANSEQARRLLLAQITFKLSTKELHEMYPTAIEAGFWSQTKDKNQYLVELRRHLEDKVENTKLMIINARIKDSTAPKPTKTIIHKTLIEQEKQNRRKENYEKDKAYWKARVSKQ